MANIKTVKNNIVATSTNDSNVSNAPSTLTVVVLDSNSKPAEGAHVSIKPSDSSGVTNSAGEIQFTLTGTATKYDITAESNSKTVTVPYYVTKNGATRLVVNPVYVKNMENKLHPSFFSSNPILATGLVLGIIIAFVVFWKFFRRGRKA